MASNELCPLIDHLLALEPGTPEAEQQQYAIEGVLMATLATGGRTAGENLVHTLADNGYKLESINALPCMWRVMIPHPRVLELWFTGGEDPVVAALSYRIGAPWGSKKQKHAAELQAAFYDRYEKLCALGGPGTPALESADGLVQLVGEFEADIYNGGFGQYLENKGVKRAGEALIGLKMIGARRAARCLSNALQADASAAPLECLDQEYCDQPEDLATYVMEFLSKPQET